MATSIEEAVCAKLKGAPAVNDAVGGRVFPQFNTQEPAFPQIVYAKLAAESPVKLKGNGLLKRYTIRIDCYCETESEAAELGRAVRDAITPDGSPWTDPATGVQGGFHEDSTAEFTEDGIRFHSETFGVWFAPTS